MRIRIDWVNKKVKETYRAFHIQSKFDLEGAEKFIGKKLENVLIGNWIIFIENDILIISDKEFDKEFNHLDSSFVDV